MNNNIVFSCYTESDILKYNKKIAEFMGYTVYNKRYPRNHGISTADVKIEIVRECILEKLKYHKSFDQLIPVLEKIEHFTHCSPSINFVMGTTIYTDGTEENKIITSSTYGHESTLSMIYRAVVLFLESDWYNNKL